jgi:hypothetical protein
MKQTRAFVFGQHVSSANATTDMRDQAARSESRILSLYPRASGGNTRGWGGCLLVHFPPGFWRSAVKHPLPGRSNKGAVFPLQHHFHPNVYSKMNMTPMRPVRQLFKHLTSATKSFGTYDRMGLERLGASWGWFKGSELQAGASALPFPRPFITSAACISRDFLTVKRSTLLHSKTCAFRFVILMDRNDSYKRLPDDFRWQVQKPISLNV